MSETRAIVIRAYRRIQKACNENRGVRLSAEEVEAIWMIDDAVRTAVESEDMVDYEQATQQKP